MKHLIVCSVMWLCGWMVAMAQSVPQVIPALQQWKPAKGKLVLPESGKVIVSSDEEEALKQSAEILVQDLKEMFGWDYRVVTGKKEKGAVFLTLGKPDETLGDEGYRMDIRNEVTIEAPTSKGVFWGTRTLLQMIYHQSEGLMKGRATDFPLYPNRGFMIDVGRKFFTMDYLRDYVKILSFYKLNELQVHLNDNGFVEFFGNDWNKTYAAFRLESERYPGLTAKDGSYTKAEFRDFQKMAASYGVNVIPEIDVPAHSLAFTHYNPRLAADNKAYGMDHLDLYKQEVYDFVDSLFDEYLSGEDPVFVGPEVHIGTDEYNQKEAEQFRHFTNYYMDFISKYGKTPRLWGSLNVMKGETPVDLKGKVVSAWNYNWMDVNTCLEAGAKVVNLCDALLYLVPAVNYYHDFLDYQWLYESWMPEMMRKEDPKMAKRHPNFLGAMMAVWNDRVGNGISQQDVHLRTFPALQVVCEKMWKGENVEQVPYVQFEALCQSTPEAPGVNLLAKVPQRTSLTETDKEVALSGTDTLTTSVDEIGYPYAVEFEICPDAVPNVDAILFKGPHSEFVTNWQNTGKFAFRRDGYEFVFHAYRLPVGKWTKVRVEGDAKGTSLFVDGQLQERLEGRVGEAFNARSQRKDRIWYQETLIFPLKQLGDVHMGFKGKVKNLICIPLKK
ncbi:family 20 glycosylhydrolase [Phocaeicola sp.]|uniref:family 20 glycosylhydrolase n=1 Tax=Phocaeicola sp. TaxID=2773926 RepID=UPI00284B52CF|nr:family 20 glycosylhydrolase [Phocaeicola sp.]MDR3795604.1 family 20 glycosylhydrolase [Phocaeicola sp.]